MIKVTHYQRKPQNANYSIERVFDSVREALPPDISWKIAISRFPSRGLFKRIFNIIEAVFRQGDVNHITGDVHFLTYLLNKKKTVLTIHDMVTVERLQGIRKVLFLLFWYKIPLMRASVVTVISESTKFELLKYVNASPRSIQVVYDPVDDSFQYTPKKFNTEKPVVLHIGTGDNKNLNRVVEALAGLPCHLRIIGKLNDNQISKLMEFGIEFSSASDMSDDQIVQEYQACDLVVFVSTYEGFGLPILEAQATGRPVVTSNIMSMPEVAGRGACLVNPYDVDGIREALMKVMQNQNYRERLIKHGLENVKKFRAQEIAKKYTNIYRQIVVK